MKKSFRSVLWLAAAGVLALAIGFVLFRQVTAPLDALAEASRKIARGDLTARVAAPAGDEIGHGVRG